MSAESQQAQIGTGRIVVRPHVTRVDGKFALYSADVSSPDGSQRELWFRVPECAASQSDLAGDSFLSATVFLAMRAGATLVIQAPVSRLLVENLMEFQQAWHCWRPEKYRVVAIEAETLVETSTEERAPKSVMAFSGGVDSCYTLLRNAQRGSTRLATALFVHGFDIPLENQAVYDHIAQGARSILDGFGVEMVTMATNIREFDLDWEDAHGAALASCLRLFEGDHTVGLISSSLPYHALDIPWGSSPITDHLFSSARFTITHFGAGKGRLEKTRAIASHPLIRTHLRVCWTEADALRNCCRCQKCIITILAFRSLRQGLPAAFHTDVSDDLISRLRKVKPPEANELKSMLVEARDAGISEKWMTSLRSCILWNSVANFKQSFKQGLKALIIGRTGLYPELRKWLKPW